MFMVHNETTNDVFYHYYIATTVPEAINGFKNSILEEKKSIIEPQVEWNKSQVVCTNDFLPKRWVRYTSPQPLISFGP